MKRLQQRPHLKESRCKSESEVEVRSCAKWHRRGWTVALEIGLRSSRHLFLRRGMISMQVEKCWPPTPLRRKLQGRLEALILHQEAMTVVSR